MKRFFLGTGSQKSGTTWLIRYLQQCKGFNGGVTREYHVWDSLDVPELAKKIRSKPSLLDRLRFPDRVVVHKMQKTPDFYFDYFEGLIAEGADKSADITPSYSALSAERMAYVKEKFAERGIKCEAMMLIREPVSRIKSAVRFHLNRGTYDEGITPGTTDYKTALREYYTSTHCTIRTNYHDTLMRVDEVFSPDEVYIGVYENMFDREGVKKLAAFLGMEPNYDFASVKVGKTSGKPEDDAELEEEIRDYYSDVYDYCFERIPETRTLWQ